MQLRDPALLISILGLPAKLLKGMVNQEINAYKVATSSEGLLCIRKYWDSHCSTITKLPAIALLDNSSYPRGLSDSDFSQLLSRLTDLQQWQIWDLWDTLDVHSCGYVGCQEFTLLVVLMCAGMSQQQMQAVHSLCSSICRVFAGAHVLSATAGLMQCCQLLSLPVACLAAAMQQLQLTAVYKPSANKHSIGSSSSSSHSSNNNSSSSMISQTATACKAHSQEACDATQLAAARKDSSSRLVCSSKDSRGLLIANTQVDPGPNLHGGSSNRVLPEQTSKGSDHICCCAVECHAGVSTVTSCHQDVQLLLYLAIQYAQYAQGQHVSHYDISPSSEADEPNPSSGRPGSHSTSTSSSCILGAAIGPRPCCVGCVIS